MKRRDALVAGRRIDRREDEKDRRLQRIRDPELRAVQHVVARSFVTRGAALQRKGIGARCCLRQRVRPRRFARERRKVLLLLRLGCPAQQRVDHERVLHVDEHADGRIDRRDLFDREHRFKQRARRAAVLLGNLDAHKAEFVQLAQQASVEVRLLIHRADERRDLGTGEVADGGAEELFVRGELREWLHGVAPSVAQRDGITHGSGAVSARQHGIAAETGQDYTAAIGHSWRFFMRCHG